MGELIYKKRAARYWAVKKEVDETSRGYSGDANRRGVDSGGVRLGWVARFLRAHFSSTELKTAVAVIRALVDPVLPSFETGMCAQDRESNA